MLPREFFGRPGLEIAAGLLGCVLEHQGPDGLVAVLLTEVEAYEGMTDPASHAYRGRTRRNAVMFGPPGHAYVYFTYGMHFCVNLVCMPEGTASAVLLRAGRVIEGVPLAVRRRSAHGRAAGERDLARGPARLCQALGIDRALDGADACAPESPLRIRGPAAGSAGAAGTAGGAAAQRTAEVSSGPRVGVREGASWPWRFWLAGDPTVSAYRAHVPRRRPVMVSPAEREDGTMHR